MTRTKVTFAITTYWKRPRNEPGLTRLSSKRLPIGAALDWVLSELPEDAVIVTPDTDGGHDAVTVRIDWARVPAEIQDGTQ